MKLYRVELTKILYVVAESPEEAKEEGVSLLSTDDSEPNTEVTMATKKGVSSDGWTRSLVYGKHGYDYPAIEAVKLNGCPYCNRLVAVRDGKCVKHRKKRGIRGHQVCPGTKVT